MSGERFQVATCRGYAIHGDGTRQQSSAVAPGVSVSVCDTWRLWEEIATYRSEDRGPWPERGNWRGREQARRDAEGHARYLNGLYGGD